VIHESDVRAAETRPAGTLRSDDVSDAYDFYSVTCAAAGRLKMDLSKSFVVEDTFLGKLTYRRFIGHIRNSLSHPTYPDKQRKYASTGYNAEHANSVSIKCITFVDSPWISRGELLSSCFGSNKEKIDDTLRKHVKDYGSAVLQVTKNNLGKYQISYKGGVDPYFPKFVVKFPIEELKALARELSDYIAQPTRENWMETLLNH
jgi:hypothetical protein